nr:MAG TPA: hypothetical protein [Caudoviricetes sp.]
MQDTYQRKLSTKNKLFIADLDGKLFPIDWTQSDEERLMSNEGYRFLVRTMFKFTEMKCTPLLIHMIRHLTEDFINGKYESFVSETVNGILYYRFGNDGNFSMTITPLDESKCFLVSLSAGIEIN